MTKKLTLTEIAARIEAHLKRFEADPGIDADRPKLFKRYFQPSALRRGNRIGVIYIISHQYERRLSRAEAERYLTWLDAGNVGKHWEMPE